MKRAWHIMLLVYVFSNGLAAQLYTEYAYPGTLPSLVSSRFAGPGITISNVSFTGFNMNGSSEIRDIGFFRATNTDISIDSGIVLASGYVDPPYGLGRPSATWANYIKNTLGDSMLNTLIAPNTTVNAVVLEFDFTPNGDTVRFDYVFASDEYNHDVCNTNNDVFAFYISGPGIVGTQNIAVIPSTMLPVSVNSINNGNPGGFWPPSGCISLSYPQYFVDHGGDSTFIFNGATTVLSAVAPTIPCQTYHLRIAIADGGDTYENSAVFLSANSFNTEPIQIIPSVSYGGTDTALYENCASASLIIRRTYALAQPKTYAISYGGTATYGIDYAALPTSITMNPGQMYDTITLQPLSDAITEAMETITITIGDTLCDGTYFLTSLDLALHEQEAITAVITPGSGTICDTTLFTGTVAAGVPPFAYTWNGNVSTDTVFTFFLPGQHEIVFIAHDACGATASDTAMVLCSVPPTADFIVSPNPTDMLNPKVSFFDKSTGNVSEWMWNFGNGYSYEQNPSWIYTAPGTYPVTLTAVNTDGCSDTAMVLVTVHELPTLYVPNAFSPNDDGINDTFGVQGNEISMFSMKIFDRWGNTVYQTDEKTAEWSGMVNGTPAQIGTYIVRIEYAYNTAPQKQYRYLEQLQLIR